MFSTEFLKNSKNTFSTEHFWATASKSSKSASEFNTKIKNLGNIDCGCVICS